MRVESSGSRKAGNYNEPALIIETSGKYAGTLNMFDLPRVPAVGDGRGGHHRDFAVPVRRSHHEAYSTDDVRSKSDMAAPEMQSPEQNMGHALVG